MAASHFTIADALRFGWNTFKDNWKIVLAVSLISLLVQSFSRGLQIEGGNPNPPYFYTNFSIFGALIFLLKPLIDMGALRIFLNLYEGKKADLQDLISQYPLYLNYFIATILFGLAVGIGLVLLVIPGIILALKLQFYSYLVVDKKMGPIQALKESWRITRGSEWTLFLLALVFIGIAILGLILFGVGLIIAMPVITLAATYVYKKLTHHATLEA